MIWFQNSPGAAESGRNSESFIVRERSFGGQWDEFLRQMHISRSGYQDDIEQTIGN